VRGTVALNSELCGEHPRIIEECNRLNWELMGHNETNTKRLNSVPVDEEAGLVRRTVRDIEKASGQVVKGWLSSGLSETWNSLEHLVDNNVKYVADWVNDDQPYPMTLEDGRTIMSIPYSLELNDKPAFDKMHRTAEQFDMMIRRQFDVLWREGADQAREQVASLSIRLMILKRKGWEYSFSPISSPPCRRSAVWYASTTLRMPITRPGSRHRQLPTI
jgi:peptidoglycan/xylan/chitin deacetylase (PgdA/CDA1 family)